MARFEINKKQLSQNFIDAFFYASWVYIILVFVGAAVGVVGFLYGLHKDVYMLTLGIAATVMGGLAFLMVAFQFVTLYLVFFGKFKMNYPDGVKVFEIERAADGFVINNISKKASSTLHFYNIAKVAKTKRTILIKLKRGTIFGFPRSEELDKVFDVPKA